MASRIARGILQAGEGRLRGQIRPRLRQVPAGELERRISAQRAEVVAILIAARDGEDAGADHVRHSMPDAGWMRRSGMKPASRSAIPSRRSAWARSMTPPSDDKRPPSKAAVIFLRQTAGNGNVGSCIVRHGGCGTVQSVAGVSLSNQILRCFKCLSYIRQPSSAFSCIRTARSGVGNRFRF